MENHQFIPNPDRLDGDSCSGQQVPVHLVFDQSQCNLLEQVHLILVHVCGFVNGSSECRLIKKYVCLYGKTEFSISLGLNYSCVISCSKATVMSVTLCNFYWRCNMTNLEAYRVKENVPSVLNFHSPIQRPDFCAGTTCLCSISITERIFLHDLTARCFYLLLYFYYFGTDDKM